MNMMASNHASKTQGLGSLLTASCHIQEPHPLLVIRLAQILAKKRPSFISASSLIGTYFFPVEIQVHPPIFEILQYFCRFYIFKFKKLQNLQNLYPFIVSLSQKNFFTVFRVPGLVTIR